MNRRQTLALAAFAIRTNGRMWMTRGGIIGGAAILFLGPVGSLLTGGGWALDPALAFYGLLVALTFALRSGLAEQRSGDLDLFLAHDVTDPGTYAAGLLLSLVTTWALIWIGGFAAMLVASGGDIATATWHAASWSLRSGVLLGFVPLLERYSNFRLPLLIPALAYFLTLIGLSVVIGEDRAIELLVVARREEPSTLVPLAAQAVALTAAGFAAFWSMEVLRGRRVRRVAQIVPMRHGGAPPRV